MLLGQSLVGRVANLRRTYKADLLKVWPYLAEALSVGSQVLVDKLYWLSVICGIPLHPWAQASIVHSVAKPKAAVLCSILYH